MTTMLRLTTSTLVMMVEEMGRGRVMGVRKVSMTLAPCK